MSSNNKITTDQLIGKKRSREEYNYGYVYIESNPSFPEIIKIGSSKDYEQRRIQKSSSTPYPFKTEYKRRCYDKTMHEKRIHNILKQYCTNRYSRKNIRGQSREFFKIKKTKAITVAKVYFSTHNDYLKNEIHRLENDPDADVDLLEELETYLLPEEDSDSDSDYKE